MRAACAGIVSTSPQPATLPLPSPQHLSMNGPEIVKFTLEAVPQCANDLYQKAGITAQDVDYFVFHQANGYMLEHLRQKMGIPEEKFALCVRDSGNTVFATVPIALNDGIKNGRIRPGMRVMVMDFGVGLSWAATLVRLYDRRHPSLPCRP